MRSVELFAGAGGLAMGIGGVGFEHVVVIEKDAHACGTVRENQAAGCPAVAGWPLFEGDARDFHYERINGEVDLVSGGPPCQPFSLGGKHRGRKDSRDMFPEAIRAVRELKPKAFIFENVRGLARPKFHNYLEYIKLQLTYPELQPFDNENWEDHTRRLQRHHTGGMERGLIYNVLDHLGQAADFGVPQKRERLFIVGIRSDLGLKWCFPRKTHDLDALLWSQWISGDYWDLHRIPKRQRPEIPRALVKRVEKLKDYRMPPRHHRWLTVRDAISDLPDPESNGQMTTLQNHVFNPGARSYPGHTGSPLDEPAKTLKAGDHGVPGGENMLRRPDGSIRYFTVRESARLQTFPDDYFFGGTWSENMRQLGNAVPVRLAEAVARGVRECLEKNLA